MQELQSRGVEHQLLDLSPHPPIQQGAPSLKIQKAKKISPNFLKHSKIYICGSFFQSILIKAAKIKHITQNVMRIINPSPALVCPGSDSAGSE